MLNGEDNRYRCGDEGYVEHEHREENKRQGDVVVACPVPLDILDFFPGPAGLQTSGTEVFTVKVTITERAEKSAATGTRQDCLFRRMVEAGGLSFQKNTFGRLSGSGSTKECGEQLCLQAAVAA